MWKYLCIVIGILYAVTAPASPAFAWGSQGYGTTSSKLCDFEDTQISVSLASAKTRYIYKHDMHALTQMHKAGRSVLGLAGGPVEISVRSRYRIKAKGDKVCVHLDHVDVVFQTKPEIHIASDFQPGSCAYREIIAHEQRHVKVLRVFMREYAPELQELVKKTVKTSRQSVIVSKNGIKSAKKQLKAPVISRIKTFQAQIYPVLQSRQAALDTSSEYRRIAEQCNAW